MGGFRGGHRFRSRCYPRRRRAQPRFRGFGHHGRIGRSLVIHGHFYQPPRENPWTGELAREPSAAPFHDWNERIAAECYRANGHARIVDAAGRVISIVNNYERLSFDVGPTLMAWLEEHDADAYARILDGDRIGGGAIAQAYYHVILPLAGERDVRTQVRWGLADFRHRFGRDAAGIWLPETAVNDAVLAVLADEGVAFTILAPSQAVGEVDPRRPYRWHHPSGDGRGVDIVFYDGPLSHSIAFENVSSQALLDRVVEGGEGGVVCVATDGETFGHHHHYADRALAYALAVEAPRRDVVVTTPAAFLAAAEERLPVEIHESAWSCAHGVGRWREDCGCSTGGEPDWNQRWRAPLRAALDLLRDAADEVYERRGGKVLRDAWAARDGYIDVILGARTRDDFAADHVVGDGVEAFTLLEAQRHALAMYTSCGWFFNDLAGLETVLVLKYAARVMDLLRDLGEEPPEDAFLALLASAVSNDPNEGDGGQIWRRHVLPSRVDATRVVAHLALVELLEHRHPGGTLAGFAVDRIDHADGDRGAVAVCSGRIALTHERTGRRTEHVYAALRLGGLEVLGAVRPSDPSRDAGDLTAVRTAFDRGDNVTRLLRRIAALGDFDFDLRAALPDAAEQILESAAAALTERFAGAFDRLFDDHRGTLTALAHAGYPLPAELRAPAELALARRFETAVAEGEGSWDPAAYRSALDIARGARAAGYAIDTPAALDTMRRIILGAVERAVAATTPDAVETALSVLRLARALDLHPDVDAAQEAVYDALVERPTPDLRLLGTALGLAVERLGRPA